MSEKWSDKEVKKLTQNYGKCLNRDLSKILNGRSTHSVFNKANKLGLKSDQRKMSSVANKTWTHNTSFFKTPSLLSSYWAGFISADACIQNKGSSLRIKLQERDKNHLYLFKKHIEYSGNILNKKEILNGKTFNLKVLNICGAKNILEDLKTIYNIGERKSLTLLPPNIDDFYNVFSYIIGYIDGDGCISTYLQKNKYPYVQLSILGTEIFLKWISDFMKNRLGIINTGKIRKKTRGGKIFTFNLYGASACDFIERAIELKTVKLKRKWLKYEKSKKILRDIGR